MSFGDPLGPGSAASSGMRKPLLADQATDALGEIASLIGKISTNVAQLRQMVELLSTPSDNRQLRDNLTSLRHDTNELAKQTRAKLAAPYDRAIKAKHDRLMTQFQTILKQYEQVAGESLRKERARAVTLSESYRQRESVLANRPAAAGTLTQDQLAFQEIANVDAVIIEEQNRAVREVEQDLEELSEVFRDVAQMVHEQGAQLNSVEQQVGVAYTQVERGVLQLETAEAYQSNARKKILIIIVLCCCIACVLIAIVAIGLGIGLWQSGLFSGGGGKGGGGGGSKGDSPSKTSSKSASHAPIQPSKDPVGPSPCPSPSKPPASPAGNSQAPSPSSSPAAAATSPSPPAPSPSRSSSGGGGANPCPCPTHTRSRSFGASFSSSRSPSQDAR